MRTGPDAASLTLRLLAAGQLALEALDAATAVDQLLLARVEGVALIADLDLDRLLGGAGLERVAAGANDLRDHVVGMNVGLHEPAFSKDGAPTKAKPEIWTDRAEFDKLLADLGEKAKALPAAAKAGTLDALKPAVGEVGKACKACHDKYKEK